MKTAIKCGKLFDPKQKKVLTEQVIIVEGKQVLEVTTKVPEGMEVIDLGEYFVMPGLIDAHVHTTDSGDADALSKRVLMGTGDYAFESLLNAQRDLKAGFTTIRDAGSRQFVDVALKKAIDRGDFDGPNMMVSCFGLSTTGGHADSDANYSHLVTDTSRAGNVFDGADQARQAVRFVLKNGANYVKFMATGGVMSRGTTVGAQQMTYEEMRALCETAEMYGVHSATHAHGTNGIKDAVRAGVTSVEHGTMLDDECIELMLKQGTYLTPTLIAPVRIIEYGVEAGISEWGVNKAKQVSGTHKIGLKKAYDAGVNICFGSDAATPFNRHGEQTYEFELMVDAGIPAIDCLVAATHTNSVMMRMSDRVGSIEAGKLADIVAYKGDPLADIKVMNHCAFVMSRGKVIVHQ